MDASGQAQNGHGLAGGVGFRKIAPIHGVDRPKQIHAGQKDAGFDNTLKAQALALENRLQIEHDPMGLFLYAGLHEFAGGGVQGDLAGDKQGIPVPNGLGIRPDGFGG